ncbi:MAG: hypothetical protein KAI24_23445, partial [Planctomycetes bacterium]|nr:hypothetical protein [Planctomycetota bacterium]
TAEVERSLREASPIVWSLRGNWNEWRYRLGVLHADRVQFGRDGWLFLRQSVTPDLAGFEQAAERRRAFLVGVRDRLRAAGVDLVVSLVPDKVRVHTGQAFDDARLPARREAVYVDTLRLLEELSIPVVDLATPLRAAAAGSPEPLYYRGDTHWRPGGALVAGTAVAAVVERRFGAELSRRVTMALTGPTRVRGVGDLVGMLGLLTRQRADDENGEQLVATSLLTERLTEQRDYYGLEVRGPQGARPMTGADPAAEVWLAGTSFAEENGMEAISFALGRPLFAVLRRGAPGLESLRDALGRIEAGARPKVLVWEIVERGLFADAWRSPRLRD